MCGRIACTLGVQDLCCATACKPRDGIVFAKSVTFGDIEFVPSYNIPPTTVVPVIVSPEQRNFESNCVAERTIVPMRFGVIPPWIKLYDCKADNLETHLCKIERARESKLYNTLLERGNRCVIPCVGYYEWQSTKSINKQPYFFYNKRNSPESLKDAKGTYTTEDGWVGVQLLYLAGVYSAYTDEDGKRAYSFAIMTREAVPEWKWVHNRMPVVLQSDKEINRWIRSHSNLITILLDVLKKPIENLAAHAVDRTIINNARNNDPKCMEPMTLGVPKIRMMREFLSTVSKPKCTTTEENKKPAIASTPFSIQKWLSNTEKKVPKKRLAPDESSAPDAKKRRQPMAPSKGGRPE